MVRKLWCERREYNNDALTSNQNIFLSGGELLEEDSHQYSIKRKAVQERGKVIATLLNQICIGGILTDLLVHLTSNHG